MSAVAFDTTSDESLLALLSDSDIDLEFFEGLFEDLLDDPFATTASTSIPVEAKTPPPSPPLRRQRRLAAEINRFWPETETIGEWRRIAKRQQKEREKSEKENAELRELVAAHSKSSRRIYEVLNKAVHLASGRVVLSPDAALAIAYFGPTPCLSHATLDLDLLASTAVDMLSRRTFPSTTSTLFNVESRTVNMATGDAAEDAMEVAWVLPFDVATIAKTLLARSVRLVTKKNCLDAKTVYENANLKVVQAVTRTKQKKNLLISKHGYVVTRREPPRSDGSNLLVMAARGGFVLDTKLVVHVEGDKFFYVSKVPGHDEAKLGPLSRVHWYMHRRFRAQSTGSASITPEDRVRWIHQHSSQSAQRAEREIDKLTVAMETLLLSPA